MTAQWPTAPLIRIDKGTLQGTDISGTTATLTDIDSPEFDYYLLDGPKSGYTIFKDFASESITDSRPCAAIPIGELSFLRDVFMGAKLSKNQITAIQRLSSYLPRTAADESE